MLNEKREITKTGRYVLSYNVPDIELKGDNVELCLDWVNKVIVDEIIGETIILVKHETTHDDLEGINIGDKLDMKMKYLSVYKDNQDNFTQEREYKDMYLIYDYHTDMYCWTDMVKVFSNVKEPRNLDKIIKRDEQDQLKNTIHKLKPDNAYKIESELKDLNTNINIFAKELIKTMERVDKQI